MSIWHAPSSLGRDNSGNNICTCRVQLVVCMYISQGITECLVHPLPLYVRFMKYWSDECTFDISYVRYFSVSRTLYVLYVSVSHSLHVLISQFINGLRTDKKFVNRKIMFFFPFGVRWTYPVRSHKFFLSTTKQK